MQPCDIGIIIQGSNSIGHIVMRTASKDKFEVMDLSCAGADKCWTGGCSLKVQLLSGGESVTLTV